VLDTSLSGVRVVRELDRLCSVHGRPAMIVSDNGTELTSHAVLRWVEETSIEWHYIAPGRPVQNAFVESSPRRMPQRACLPIAIASTWDRRSLAQVLQRGTPARGDRAKTPDYLAEPQWRSQPATVMKPENSSFR
jgi:transposase InsO family protein